MKRILNAIANTAIAVPAPVFALRNVIMASASVVCIYIGATLEPSITAAMLIGGGCSVLYMIAKGN